MLWFKTFHDSFQPDVLFSLQARPKTALHVQISLGQPLPDTGSRAAFLKLEAWSTDALNQLFMSIFFELQVVRYKLIVCYATCSLAASMLSMLLPALTSLPR